MTTNTYRILIGANGWLHPAWQTTFYPADLPPEWQLGYYSNEFPIVLMPSACWQYPDEELASWLAESADRLQLICEIPAEYLPRPVDEALQSINRFFKRVDLLGGRCLGLLFSLATERPDMAALAAQLHRKLPLCIDLAPDLPAEYVETIQKMCKQQQVGLCWHGNNSTAGLNYGPLALTKIDSRGMAMRQLRDVVETILTHTSPRQTSVLIIDGDPPDLEAMRHTGVILDLF